MSKPYNFLTLIFAFVSLYIIEIERTITSDSKVKHSYPKLNVKVDN